MAGQFYPADPEELQTMIKQYLAAAEVKWSTERRPRAVMVPHAGYVFSGPVAAYAYKTLTGQAIRRVFLLGNSHRAYFDGMVVDDSEAWETPLGTVVVDKGAAEKLASRSERIFFNGGAHQGDHILEVQLPFLQTVLEDDFQIVPLVFGNQNPHDYQELGRVLSSVWEEGDLVVASSDLSHYPPAEVAETIDRQTLEYIAAKDIEGLEEYIAAVEARQIPQEETVLCGPEAVKTIMWLAQERDWSGEILRYAHSGNVPFGDSEQVVGYGAVGFGD